MNLWEQYQEECAWCGDQGLITSINTENSTPVDLCDSCLERYKEQQTIDLIVRQDARNGLYSSLIKGLFPQ